MHALRLCCSTLLLAGCLAPLPILNTSQYACPNGWQLQAGLTADQRLMRLTLAGRTHTLRQDGDIYSDGRITARRDDLFLHLAIAGTLLPQHCQLLFSRETRPPAGRP